MGANWEEISPLWLESKLRELDIVGFIQLIVYASLGENIIVLGSRQVFYEMIS